MLLIDISKSSVFGSIKQFKSELTAELSAVIAFSAITNNDKVGAILFTDTVEKYIPPKKGKKHILRIIREIIYYEPKSNGTKLEEALIYLNNIQKKKAIAFILSDFMTQGYEPALSVATRQVRSNYNKWYSDNYDYYDTTFNRYRSDHLSISTADDYVKLLLQFFKRRSK